MREIKLRMMDPFRTASSTTTDRHAIVLKLHDADGTTAWSECVAELLPTYSPETVDTCWLANAAQLRATRLKPASHLEWNRLPLLLLTNAGERWMRAIVESRSRSSPGATLNTPAPRCRHHPLAFPSRSTPTAVMPRRPR